MFLMFRWRYAVLITGLVLLYLMRGANGGSMPESIAAPAKTLRYLSVTTIPDETNFGAGKYLVYSSTFGKGTLKSPADYADSFSIKDSFPDDTAVHWRWPTIGNRSIRAFISIQRGSYYGVSSVVPFLPSRVKDIKSLIQTHQFSYTTSDPEGFDALIDGFWTAKSGDGTKPIGEYSIFLHTPNYTKLYCDAQPPLGQFIDPQGRIWNASRNPVGPQGPILLWYPADQRDILQGDIDIGAFLQWATTVRIPGSDGAKALTGIEWINGYAIGVEPQQGSGTLWFKSLSETYAQANASLDSEKR